mmetsp:Transcript_25014/g.39432  ORF Transcript_25014/g.39432 Transcript_25014/m.39432 type:complete len:88 (-) Transcript_25014:555-818(-)
MDGRRNNKDATTTTTTLDEDYGDATFAVFGSEGDGLRGTAAETILGRVGEGSKQRRHRNPNFGGSNNGGFGGGVVAAITPLSSSPSR